ncbi:MAG: ABC transporter permease [Pseudomonadota bacterium]
MSDASRSDLPASETFAGKFAQHIRVVRALIRRDIRSRYARTSGGFLWAIGEPALMIMLLAFVFSFLLKTPPIGETFIEFKMTGFLAYFLFRQPSNTGAGGINYNLGLMSFPAVTPYDAVVARFYIEFLTVLASTLAINMLVYGYYGRLPEFRVEYLMLCIALTFGLVSGVSFVNAVLFWRYPSYERIYSAATRPLLILSGVLYLPDQRLPSVALDVLWWNPLIHTVAIFRQGYYPTYNPDFISYEYLIFWIILLNAVGLSLITYHRYSVLER